MARRRLVVTGKPAKSTAALRRSMPLTPDSTVLVREMRDAGY
jgi:hypothetical protein